jgi:hypothetical protein
LPLYPTARRRPLVGVRVLRACSFVQFRDGLIYALTTYFSLPTDDLDPWSRDSRRKLGRQG